jgi:uncharacterized protein
MPGLSSLTPDLVSLIFVVLGASVAGFVSGFAGFGAALVASGLWYHALPAPFVAPLVVLTGLTAQLTSLTAVAPVFDWKRVTPFLIGGVIGIPIGVLALSLAAPTLVKVSVGIFLVAYAASQLAGVAKLRLSATVNRFHDALVGLTGGFLGGFAGLSGPPPLIWLQLKGGPSAAQRAIYQPFNLVILAVSGLALGLAGLIPASLLPLLALSLPVTALSAWIGARLYRRASDTLFRRVVLLLLLASGLVLLSDLVRG